MAAFNTERPCDGKAKRPPGPGALAEAARLLGADADHKPLNLLPTRSPDCSRLKRINCVPIAAIQTRPRERVPVACDDRVGGDDDDGCE